VSAAPCRGRGRRGAGGGGGTFVAVMSCTSHFMFGRFRRFFSSISLMTVRLKSMFVMSVQPASYLRHSLLSHTLNSLLFSGLLDTMTALHA